MKVLLKPFLSILLLMPLTAILADENPVVDAMIEYMDFASYGDGTITKQQMQSLGLENLVIVDARSEERYEASHIKNAINIEWRQVLGRMEEIPKDKTVVLYCDSGLLSSKAHFALKLAGYENVRVLLGGYAAWK